MILFENLKHMNPFADVKLSTSDCILEVNELNELVVVNDPV
jgi:hypothetical protein